MEGKGASAVGRFESPRGKWESATVGSLEGVGVGVEVSHNIRRKFPIQVLNQKYAIAVSFSCLKLWYLNLLVEFLFLIFFFCFS